MGNVRAAVAGRFVLALAIGALVFLPASAQLVTQGPAVGFAVEHPVTNPIFEQYDECTGGGPASQQFPDFGDAVLQAADDFNVSGSQTLSQVIALGSFSAAGPITDVTIEVYDIDGPGNLPGTLLCSEVGLVSTGDGSEIDVALNGACELTSGAYWLSVMPVMSFTDFGQWFWSSNGNGYGLEFAFQDPDALVGNPCTTWGFGITDCGVGSTFPNLCFGIGGLETEDGSPGTPAVGTTGVILMLLIVMAISFFYLRRRQTA
jgi:hypothetical protein